MLSGPHIRPPHRLEEPNRSPRRAGGCGRFEHSSDLPAQYEGVEVYEGKPALVYPRRRPEASRVFVCLSFCGGGTSPMHAWSRAVPDDVEVVLVCYPGRESRYGEPYAADWEELASEVTEALVSFVRRPYVLVGHSMGGWLAFDVAARLQRSTRPGPYGLVVSASEPPSGWADQQTRPPFVTDTDEQLLAWMRDSGQLSPVVLAEPDLRDMAVSLLRADLRVSDSYRYAPGTVLDLDINVLFGAEDPVADRTAAHGWRDLTRGRCRVTELPGGHFYTPDVWATLPRYMTVPSSPR
ncbi:alpha/beta fold hydrolase [Micromonospora sp. WMMD1120]|uniref:thioesterase II family protein n=1 Tax=Micromonospora sp. WMMD1120 TaxID=3016106 RepID=UPI0024162CFB|nr:alpha/beta fold hydrolase [Micromonospora sp. WMMD1120]MDG4810802.1 alpha/beta fold hydrolase [Micromonospora sp. WMMD1120]